MPSLTGGGGFVPLSISYSAIVLVVNPGSSCTSDIFNASKFAGGIGFSIAYVSGDAAFVTVHYQNSYDGATFMTVDTAVVPKGGQDNRVFSPTRPYWRFVVVNASASKVTIDAVVSLVP